MNIPYLLKATAFWGLTAAPRGLHDFLSLRVTGRSRRDPKSLEPLAARHAANFDRFCGLERERAAVLEFGAGADLVNNIWLLSKGFHNQAAVDLERILDPKLVVDAARTAGIDIPMDPDHVLAALARRGLRYAAPCDMRCTGLPDSSMLMVLSTNVLEHVPLAQMPQLLAEIRRILNPRGICSFAIDHSDHYAHTDRTITEYNFLRFGEGAWRFLNPPNHFQHRARAADLRRIFLAAGLEILDEDRTLPADWRRKLARTRIHRSFAQHAPEDLACVYSWFVLRKAR